MHECYGLINASVQGTDKKFTPAGYDTMPDEHSDTIIKCFRDRQAVFRYGMCKIRLNKKQTYYLRACSRQQTPLTAMAPAVCVYADICDLMPNDFFDENLDSLLSASFPSEIDIVNGNGKIQKGTTTIDSHPLQPELIKVLLTGCVSRMVNMTAPVYIALPVDDFELRVAQVLKAVYLSMPFALRAHSGFMTYPHATFAIPEFVSICFIPLTWCKIFPGEPIITLDSATCQNEIEKIINRSGLDEKSSKLVDYICSLDKDSRKQRFDEYYKAFEGEVEGDSEVFSSLDGHLYGYYHYLSTNWKELSTEAKDEFVFNFIKEEKSVLTEMTWKLIAGHITEKHLREILDNKTASCRTFDEFVSALKPLLPINIKLNLKNAWQVVLSSFIDKIQQQQQLLTDFRKVRPELEKFFNAQFLQSCEERIKKLHEEKVAAELSYLSTKLKDIQQERPLLQWLQKYSAVFSEVCFSENRELILQEVRKKIQICFTEACKLDTNFKRYDEIEEVNKAFDESLKDYSDGTTKEAWHEYNKSYEEYKNAKKDLKKYFISIQNGNNPDYTPEFTVSAYTEDFLEFVRTSKKGHEALARLWGRAFDDWDKLMHSNADFLIEDIHDCSLLQLHEKCIKYGIFADEQTQIAFSKTGKPPPRNYISLKDARDIREKALQNKKIDLSGKKIDFAVLLANKGILKNDNYDLLFASLKDNMDKLEFLIMLAGYAVIQNQYFLIKGKRYNALEYIIKAKITNIKDIDVYNDSFTFTADADNLKKLEQIWDKAVKKHEKRNNFYIHSRDISRGTSSSKNKTKQLLLAFVALIVISTIIFTAIIFKRKLNDKPDTSTDVSSSSIVETVSSTVETSETPTVSESTIAVIPQIVKPDTPIIVGDKFQLEVKGLTENSDVFWTIRNANYLSIISDENKNKITLEAKKVGNTSVEVHSNNQNGPVLAQIEITVEIVASSTNYTTAVENTTRQGVN